jgi:hypothetical protein
MDYRCTYFLQANSPTTAPNTNPAATAIPRFRVS